MLNPISTNVIISNNTLINFLIDNTKINNNTKIDENFVLILEKYIKNMNDSVDLCQCIWELFYNQTNNVDIVAIQKKI